MIKPEKPGGAGWKWTIVLLAGVLSQGVLQAGEPGPACRQLDLNAVIKSRQLMPDALKQLMIQREQVIRQGFQSPAARTAARPSPEQLLAAMEGLTGLLSRTPDFDEVLRRFGTIAGLVCRCNGYAGFASGEVELAWLEDFEIFLARESPRFVPVFYDYSPALFIRREPRVYLAEMEQRSQDYSSRLFSCYRQGGSSRTFDCRSPAFGVASLHYSHLITDIANLWLYCWREAKGDMAGVPFFPYPIAAPAAGRK